MNSIKNLKCFVIMPFSKTHSKRDEIFWTEHFDEFICPQVKSALPGIIVERSKVERGSILNGIITNLVLADIVLADITDANPNVYWELGIRHSFSNGTVIIAKSHSRIPFDISSIGIHKYTGASLGERRFLRVNEFSDALKNCVSNTEVNDSHVLEILKGRGSLWFLFDKRRINLALVSLVGELNMLQVLLLSIEKQLKASESLIYLSDQLLIFYALQRMYSAHLIDDFEFHTDIYNLMLTLNRINRLIDIAPILGVKSSRASPLVSNALNLCKRLSEKSIALNNALNETI